jgi:hypothetical protein
MAAYSTLIAYITNIVKSNFTGDITGASTQSVLLNMVSALGDKEFKGLADPSTDPGLIQGNASYLACAAGSYSYFGLVIAEAGLYLLSWNPTTAAWSSTVIPVAASAAILAIQQSAITANEIAQQNSYRINELENSTDFLSQRVIDIETLMAEEVSMLEPEKNMFNKLVVDRWFFINHLNGEKVYNDPYALYASSRFIRVTPDTKYTYSGFGTDSSYAWYDSTKVFISGAVSVLPFITSPINAAFIQVTFTYANLNTTQLEVGLVATTYMPFKMVVSINKQQSQVIKVEGLKILLSDWVLVNSMYENKVYDSNIFTDSIVNIIPTLDDSRAAMSAQILPQTIPSLGFVTVYALNIPTQDINISVNIFIKIVQIGTTLNQNIIPDGAIATKDISMLILTNKSDYILTV